MDDMCDSDQELAAPSYTAELTGLREKVAPGTGAYMQQERVGSAEPDGLQVSMPQNFTMTEAGISETYADSDGVWTPTTGFGHVSGSFQDAEFSGEYTEAATTMESAICSAVPAEVTARLDLLRNMSKVSMDRELTGCYGGRRGNPPRVDDNGLFRMTVPLLHAAFTGSTGMFSTVLGAMRANLRPQQVRRALVARDGHERTILAMALASKSKSLFEATLAALEEDLTRNEVKELMMTPDADGQKILHWAAATGCLHTFETVLSALGSRLDQGEVEHLLAASTAASTNDIFSESRTVLNSAASSGGSQVFVAVLDELEGCLSAWQVKRMMIYQDTDLQENLLHSAINSGSTNAFDTVLSALTSRLTPTEARNFLLRADDGLSCMLRRGEVARTCLKWCCPPCSAHSAQRRFRQC